MLELECPDLSVVSVDCPIVIGRASSIGGLRSEPKASRQQLEICPVPGVEDALSLKVLGQNGESSPAVDLARA